MKTQIEPVSTEHLLKCMGHAIDEAKYLRQLIHAKDAAAAIKQEKPFSDRLIHLNREIAYLESRLEDIRSDAGKYSKTA